MITVGSLFSGIGGFDLGLEWAGMSVAWQVEIDPFCKRVLAKHWPSVERHSDVKECGAHNLQAVDLICGGFPCQPHSVAGKRRGAADDRDLWPEYRRIVSELRPRWVLAENVPGIRTTILDQVLSDLEDLDYAVGALVIPACAFDLPHRRERIFIVGYTERSGCNRVARRRAGKKPPNGYLECDTYAAIACQSGLSQRSGQTGQRTHAATPRNPWRQTQPAVCGRNDVVPRRVDRLRSLGNAVAPVVVEFIGRYIVEVDAMEAK